MVQVRFSRFALQLSIVAVVAHAPAATARPFRIWPTVFPPCNSTLQACIDGAAEGDQVYIDTDGPIDESISFTKGLTLAAASGFHPVFSPSHYIEAMSSLSDDHTIRIEGLTLQEGGILIVQQSTGVLTAQVVDNVINRHIASSGAGISIIQDYGATGPINFDVSGNSVQISTTSYGGTGIEFGAGVSSSGTVEHNVVAIQPGDDQVAAIDLLASQADLIVDVIANRISLTSHGIGVGYGWGISIRTLGTAVERVIDNLITDQTGNVNESLTAAISISANSSLQATVVNNTLANNVDGVIARTLPGSSSLVIANNALTTNSSAGLSLLLDPSTTLVQDYNLFYGNALDIDSATPVMPGPHSVFASPHYAGPGDYRPVAPSAAIDAGDDAAVPVGVGVDLDGNPRIQGSHVDIGAFESVPEPAGSLAGGAALVALRALGRRTGGRTRSCRRNR